MFGYVEFFIVFLATISYSALLTFGQVCIDCHRVTGGEELVEPQQLTESTHGNVTLQVDISNVTFAGLTLKRRLFNGFLSGPTLIITESGFVRIEIANKLTQDRPSTYINYVALNFQQYPFIKTKPHSFSCDPAVNQSYQMTNCDLVPPQCNCSFTLTQVIITGNPTGATGLYRSQPVRVSEFQVQSGLAGLIVIRDEKNSALYNLTEKQLLFQSMQYSNTTAGSFSKLQIQVDDNVKNRLSTEEATWMENPSNGINFITVNGQVKPTVSLKAGICTRLRMGNAAAVNALILSMDTTSCDVYEIARDGFYFQLPKRILASDNLLLPGGTLDWIISCRIPGMFELGSHLNKYNSWKFDVFEGLLLTFNVSGTATLNEGCPNVQSYLNLHPPNNQSLNNKTSNTSVYEIEVGGPGINRELFPNGSSGMNSSGYKQKWSIVNSNPVQAVPVSMTQGQFQVISYNDYVGPVYQQHNSNWFLVDRNGCLCDHQFEGYINFTHFSPLSSCNLTQLSHVENWKDNEFGYSEPYQWVGVLLVPPLGNITVIVNFLSFDHQAFLNGPDGKSSIQINDLSKSDKGAIINYDMTRELLESQRYIKSCHICTSNSSLVNMSCTCNQKCNLITDPNSTQIDSFNPEPTTKNNNLTNLIVCLAVSLIASLCHIGYMVFRTSANKGCNKVAPK